MNVEITRTEIEVLIRQRLKTGAFASEQDVALHALHASAADQLTGANLVAAMQASPFPEIEFEPVDERTPVRGVEELITAIEATSTNTTAIAGQSTICLTPCAYVGFPPAV